MLQNTGLLNINKNYRAIDKMTYQGSTMKKVQYSSDSPIDTVNQMKYKTENSKIEQYLVNLKDAQDWTNLTESVMRQSKEALDRIRTLTVQAGNDSYSAEDRAKIADEVNQLLEALVDQSNTTIGGSYLFSGTEILKGAPFQITRGTDATGKLSNVITKVEYTGDYQEIIREIEKFTTIKVNENGNEVFMALPQKIQIPSSLNDASTKLNLLNGLTGAQRGYFQINDAKIYYDTTNDSLLDLKNKINAADNGVIAEITGKLTGSVSFADSSSALNLSGRFVLNGQAINVVSSDSLAGIAEKINNLTKTTGVSAEITVDNQLVLKGGVELGFETGAGVQSILSDLGLVDNTKLIGSNNTYEGDVKGGSFEINGTIISIADNATIDDIVLAINNAAVAGVTALKDANGSLVLNVNPNTNGLVIKDSSNAANLTSDIFKKFGLLTSENNIKANIISANVTEPYKLVISSATTAQMFINDIGAGKFLRDSGVVVEGKGVNPPNNIAAAAVAEKMSVFDLLINIRDNLLSNNASELRGKNIENLDKSIDNLMSRIAAIGAKNNRLEKTEDRLETLKLNNKTLLADAEEIDWSKLVTDLQKMQTVQTAALQINSQIFKLSLMNFL